MHEKTAHEGYKRPDKSKSDHHVIEHGDRKFLWILSTDTKSIIQYMYELVLHILQKLKLLQKIFNAYFLSMMVGQKIEETIYLSKI